MIPREILKKIRQIEIRTNCRIPLCLALVLSGVLLGCSTNAMPSKWPVFYHCEKPSTRISVLYDPQPLGAYTNGIPDWNHDLRVPVATIKSAETRELTKMEGLRVIWVRLSLNGLYYSDALMILQEVKPNQFMPVYVQDYNRKVRIPSEIKVLKLKRKIIIETGMIWFGSGGLRDHYKIVITPNQKPHVSETSI